jgi:hypothetical protein
MGFCDYPHAPPSLEGSKVTPGFAQDNRLGSNNEPLTSV